MFGGTEASGLSRHTIDDAALFSFGDRGRASAS
jgi:hypothetical protein